MSDSVATTITDDRFRQQTPMPLLNSRDDVTLVMTVNAGPIGHILMRVFDAEDKQLADSGARSTGAGEARWTFSPAQLAAPRYVLWNMWVSFNGPRPLQFTVRVVATQAGQSHTAAVKVQMEADQLIVRITEIGDFLAIGKSPP